MQVCIDPDLRNINPTKVCRPEPVVLTGGQGAPVAVTRVESAMVPEGDKVRPVFKVYVEHAGTGSVVRSNNAEMACSAEVDKSALESYVGIYADLQGVPLSCSPEPLKLKREGESRFVCTAERLYELAEGTFISILYIELDYGYVSTALMPVTISRLPGQASC